MTKINKNAIKWTVLLMSLTQQGMLAISAVIADISKAFPTVSDQTVQFLMTFPGFFIMVMSLLSAGLTKIISRKKLMTIGMALCLSSGIGGFLFHSHIAFCFLWAILLGTGVGLWMPLATAVASDYFENEERASLLGTMSGAQNLGAMLMSLIGGILAVSAWSNIYLVYLIAIPGLIFCIIFIPETPVDRSAEEQKSRMKIDNRLIIYSFIIFYFSLFYNAGPANFSLILAERNIGNSSTAGVLSSLMLLGGVLMGFVFGKISDKIEEKTIPMGLTLLAIGFFGLGFGNSVVISMVCAVIAGMSISLVLPQVSFQVVKGRKPEEFAMATAIALAMGNLGAFATPLTTTMAEVVTGSSQVSIRMMFCSAGSLLGVVLSVLLCRKNNNVEISDVND